MAGIIAAGILGRQPAEHGDQHRHRALRRDAEEPGRHADAEERLLRRQDRPGPRRHGADHRILLAVGVLAYGVDLPSGSDWFTFVWVAALGSAACTLLGIAVSSLAKNGRSASAMVTPIALVLQFISGVFFLFSQVPVWMQTIASFFPLKWMAQGLRSVFLPDVAGRRGAGRLLGARPGGARPRASGASPGCCSVSPPSAGRTATPAELRFAAGACPLTAETIARAPKVLLHDHLDGGLRPQTVLELADEFGYRDLPAADPRASAPGSGRRRTPARWCSTWRRSRTPSA